MIPAEEIGIPMWIVAPAIGVVLLMLTWTFVHVFDLLVVEPLFELLFGPEHRSRRKK